MFAQDFKKFYLVVASLLVVGSSYVGVHLGLNRLAYWAETKGDTFPYQAGEDPMRFLLPTLMKYTEGKKIFLTGSSSAGEGLLYEKFDREFPAEFAYPGAVSAGTLDDILVLLDYIEKVYGKSAMPKTLVLGISLRFISNIPRRFGHDRDKLAFSPVFGILKRYSSFYVESTPEGSRLRAKGLIDRLKSNMSFLIYKQSPRYRAALTAIMDVSLEAAGWGKAAIEDMPYMQNIRNPLNKNDIQILRIQAKKSGLIPLLRLWLSVYRSPYQTYYLKPVDKTILSEDLGKENNFWNKVYKWDPHKDEVMVRTQLAKLLSITRRYGIELYVINLPESIVSRRLYKGDNYYNYLKLVKESLGGTPFLELQEMLGVDEFFDEEHPTLQAAKRVTGRVIDFIREQRRHNSLKN